MGQVVGKLGLLVAVVLTMAACGGAGSEQSNSPKPEASTTGTGAAVRTLPEQDYIPAGKYETDKFESAFSLRVDERWLAVQTPGLVALIRDENNLQIAFVRVEVVFDPSKPAEEFPKPAPKSVDGLIAWLQEHPYLDTGKPVPATVGGVTGMRIDLALSSAPKDYAEKCPKPCIAGYSTGERDGVFVYSLGEKDRAIVLDVEGETVLVTVTAPEEKFEEVLPKAQEVLDTVEWENST